jgi:UDP-3-O-[3-hydroxymyristoyl] glucosamine N-acyltransferase
MSRTISEIAELLDLAFQGDGHRRLSRVSGWDDADPTCLVFLESGKGTAGDAGEFKAGCLIAPPDLVPSGWSAIISEHPKLDFARAAALLAGAPRGSGIRHPTAVVASDAHVADDVDLGPFTVVGGRSRISAGCILCAGVVVGEDCVIGEHCILHPRVVLYPGVTLGRRVVLHAGVVAGSDGFGYVFNGENQLKFPQAGRIVIEDDVEVGANTTLDRGSLGVTRIAAGAKIDNLVQIAHNVQIGRSVVIAAQTGISGSTVIEDFAVIGGQVGFGDHARVQSGAIIGSKAGILPGKIVRGGEVYWGVPVRPLREYKRLNALFGRLPEMKADIDALKAAVAALEAAVGEQGSK